MTEQVSVEALKDEVSFAATVFHEWLEQAEGALASDDAEGLTVAHSNLSCIENRRYVSIMYGRKRTLDEYTSLLALLPESERERWLTECPENSDLAHLQHHLDELAYDALSDEEKAAIKPGDPLWGERADWLQANLRQAQEGAVSRPLFDWWKALSQDEQAALYHRLRPNEQTLLRVNIPDTVPPEVSDFDAPDFNVPDITDPFSDR